MMWPHLRQVWTTLPLLRRVLEVDPGSMKPWHRLQNFRRWALGILTLYLMPTLRAMST